MDAADLPLGQQSMHPARLIAGEHQHRPDRVRVDLVDGGDDQSVLGRLVRTAAESLVAMG